jgi:hypothetical protein
MINLLIRLRRRSRRRHAAAAAPGAAGALLLGIAGVIVTFARRVSHAGGDGARRPAGAAAAARSGRHCAFVIAASDAAAGLPRSAPSPNESDTTGSAQGRWNDALVAMGKAQPHHGRRPRSERARDEPATRRDVERGTTSISIRGRSRPAGPCSRSTSLFRTAGRVRRAGGAAVHARGRGGRRAQVAFVGFAVAAFFHRWPTSSTFLAAGLALAVQNVLRSAGPAPVRQSA